MIYDDKIVKFKKTLKGKLTGAAIIVFVITAVIIALNIYMEIIQINEIGSYSGVYLKNIVYKLLFSAIVFIIVFMSVSVTSIFIKKNLNKYFKDLSLQPRKLPVYLPALAISLVSTVITKDVFYRKALTFLNWTPFGKTDPIFHKDIGYYIFQRPFFMSIYKFLSVLWLFVIVYTAVYYLGVLFTVYNNINLKNLKVKTILRHNLINIAVFFFIKSFSYRLLKEDILYSKVLNSTGAGYVDVNIKLKYFTIAPFLLIAIVIATLIFVQKSKFKRAAYTIAIFPAVWTLFTAAALIVNLIVVKPNEFNYEKDYLKNNIKGTREAYNLDKIQHYNFPNMEKLTPEIINRNIETVNNIRVVDYDSTLTSNIQLQGNTLFYTFIEGNIVNYTIQGKDTPVFITAREMDKSKVPEKTYINEKYKYTHGYGIVINPINKLGPSGGTEFILNGLKMESDDPNLKVEEPRIYYGELTKDNVIVNAKGINEIDYDGTTETRYKGKGGIKLNFLNRLLFAIKYSDFNMLISGYAQDATLLLNREVISRAQKAVPFLSVDDDPYIIPTSDGRLKWVVDAYTVSDQYPCSQSYSNINYIRDSVKIVIDAYDGTVDYYIIDENDPIIKTYSKMYKNIFTDKPLPEEIAKHTRYPENLFSIQTEMLRKYHISPDEVSAFYTQQDLWDIAKYAPDRNSNELQKFESFYNMINLPGDIGDSEELILMRPFTPAGDQKHNMVSWLAVRNSHENYGEMILFKFPKNTNIFGPNQVEVKINQIDKVSRDMTLWGQGGSDVYKGNLLVIPIENSILYVEPIYMRSAGSYSTPEVKEIVVGYQNGDEFVYGIGTNLRRALDDLFDGEVRTPETPDQEENPSWPSDKNKGNISRDSINEIMQKYEEIKKQLDELGNLINSLKGE